jgi:uncharacterized membrane protein
LTVLWALIGLGAVVLSALGPLLAVVGLLRMSRLRKQMAELQTSLAALETRLGEAPPPPASERPVAPAPAAPAPIPPSPARVPESLLDSAENVARDAGAAQPLMPPPAAPSRTDFVGNLGPKILVGTGALAFVVFLGLFVKYAWENEWVGPWGRVTSGATLSLMLVLSGLRLLDREYRPLGQGLAAMGFAGLYLASYGAHAFYALIPRDVAGLLMVAVIASAVTLAVRLDTRLLATLAWLGGYLTPPLLSTGADQAFSLFAYLLLLALGALVIGRLKPWVETAAISFAGTTLLYAGWYSQHFRAERFEVAALGIALFTTVFGVALVLEHRPWLTALVGLNAAFWTTVMAASPARPEWLLAMSLAVAFAGAQQGRRLGRGVGVVGLVALAFPYLAWVGTHRPFDPAMLGLASLWLVGGVIAFVGPDSEERRIPAMLPALAHSFAGFAAIGLAAEVDQPLGLLVLLLALAGLAVVLRPRVSGAELMGVLPSALAVAAWCDRFYRPERGGEALLLALPVGFAYLLALGGRVLLGAVPLGIPGLATHVVSASLLFGVLREVFGPTSPGVLASTLLALAVVYGVLGFASLRARGDDPLASGTAFGLGIGFLTLAIPVWLGLHAITLAWAVEGALLLGLGVRHGSRGVRLAGHGAAGLAVIRLLRYHLPLHDGSFTPVLNSGFGTWLFVIASLGLGHWLTRGASPRSSLEGWLRPAVVAAALALLFVVTTAETQDTFAQWARIAEAGGRFDDARFARRAAGLGLSVLWTLFATSLLAGGLAARSRALYYSAYALFGFTALKVVFVDLATFPTLLRMFSFLALAVLLMAGAYLNLRFRSRLAPAEAER